MLTAILFMLAAPPTPDPEAERLRIAVAVAIEIAKAKEKPAPKVATPPSTFRYYQDARGQWWQVETVPEVGKTANPFHGTSDTTRGISAQRAGAPNTASPATYRTGNTFTGAPWTELSGATRCVSYG